MTYQIKLQQSAALIALLTVFVVLTGVAAPAGETESKQAVIGVKGLVCPICARGLEKALAKLPDTKSAKVDLEKEQAIVSFAATTKVTDTELEDTVRDAGFVPGKIEWRTVKPGNDYDSRSE